MKLSMRIDTHSEAFQRNAAHFHGLLDELKARIASAQQGGGEAACRKHTERGKLLPRDRLIMLLDSASPFLEVAPLAAADLYDGGAPSAGVIAGIGYVHGRAVMMIANDATVKGGSYFPLTVKKHLRAQEIAAENYLPCIYLVDSGGAYLPMQSEVFADREHFGRIFFNQAQLSAAALRKSPW
jgi:3-methylcrotonyl-CoA carboxylase beta subunit